MSLPKNEEQWIVIVGLTYGKTELTHIQVSYVKLGQKLVIAIAICTVSHNLKLSCVIPALF